MRLATSAPLPVVSLGIVSLVGGILAFTNRPPAPAIEPVRVVIESLPEAINLNEPVATQNEPVAPEPAAEQEAVRKPSQVFEGTYVCLQGLAYVKLTVDTDSHGNTTARYDFGPVPSNPDIPKTGAFILKGTMERQGKGFTAELDPTRWIVHPENYIMAHLSLSSPDGVQLSGKIHYEGCSDFQAKRIK